jgi:HK97 family phage prohead protease
MQLEPRSRPGVEPPGRDAAAWGVRHLTPGGTSPRAADRRWFPYAGRSRPGVLFIVRVGMIRNRAPIGLRRTTTFIGTCTKFFSSVGERQIKVIASDGSIDLMGDILEPRGAELDQYRKNPIVLAQHASDAPIARCSYIGVENAAVAATIDFPPAGTSERSDEYLALLKAGVLNAVSVGFLPIDREPLRDTGGWRYRRWSLLELSIVSVPANPRPWSSSGATAAAVPSGRRRRGRDRLSTMPAQRISAANSLNGRRQIRPKPPQRVAGELKYTGTDCG